MAARRKEAEVFVRILSKLPLIRGGLPDGQDSLPGSQCCSLVLRRQLLDVAVKKNGEDLDMKYKNLLFPPTVLRNTLTEQDVRAMLTCKCSLCVSVTGRELLYNNILVDAITTENDDELRKLFALLVFMGAGFAARHVCSFRTRGWDITNKESSLQTQLFEPLENVTRIIFSDTSEPISDTVELTHAFTTIFKKMWELFDPPVIQIRSFITNFEEGTNLPFLDEKPLNGDRGSYGLLYSFEIHQEFRGPSVPAFAVRKELPDNSSTNEERAILEFLAECKKPNFVEFLFWYRMGDKINYVFPRYPGSLYQLLEGQIELDRINITQPRPEKYKIRLQHFLWQGVVDVLRAMKFFHLPNSKILGAQIIAGHFDLKPANILVTSDGKLLITDFGQARFKASNPLAGSSLTAQAGDANYQPPPLTPAFAIIPVARAAPGNHVEDPELKWSRAYDVWSMACVMTEVIQYILEGASGFRSFRESRLREDPRNAASASFWKPNPEGGFKLKNSVEEVLRGFQATQDRYLIMVADLIKTMFAIDPLQRPPISHCLGVLEVDIPTDKWPLLDEDEVSICGLGTNPQLRNMGTKFLRKGTKDPTRCKMYLLASTSLDRVRVALEFDPEINDGESSSKATCVLSDSARRWEEDFRLVSLFDPDYQPNAFTSHECSFGILHHNLRFVFDDPRRGPQEYYHFFTAVTSQRSLRPQVHMPISKCILKFASLIPRKESYAGGHLQVWKELTVEEYTGDFICKTPPRKRSEVASNNSIQGSLRAATSFSLPSQTLRTISVSSSSSSSTAKQTLDVSPRRLVIFIHKDAPGPARLLTINLSKDSFIYQKERTGEGIKAPLSFTLRAKNSNFYIGNIPSEKGCPGIPLDPGLLAKSEGLKVDWVELEFKNFEAKMGLMMLWNMLFREES